VRYKVAPAPVDRATLRAAHEAVPLVPGSTEDCCARLQSRTTIETREAAREWLAFLDALGLATETARGYERVRTDPDDEPLGERFRELVFGVEEVLGTLSSAGAPRPAPSVFEECRAVVPRWERERHDEWERVWEARLTRLLEWGVEFGLVAAAGDGYTTVSAE